jgi:hypothetical protein
MIISSGLEFNQHIESNEEEIVLNGPPSFLKGRISLSNKADDTLFIQNLPLIPGKGLQEHLGRQAFFDINTALNPGEEKSHMLFYRLPAHFPPGNYENTVTIGGKNRKMRWVVQEVIASSIHPTSVYFKGVEPGKTYKKELMFTNKGNIPLEVPKIRHTTILDFDYLCRSLSLGIRAKGNEGFTATMDEVVKNIYRELPDAAVVNLKETGTVVDPGQQISLHFELKLPENADPTKDYFLITRIFDKKLTSIIKA